MYRHVKVCAMRPMPKNELRHRHNLLNAERRTYGFCETRLLSRNELFKHLKTCEAAGQGTIRHPGALSTSVDKDHIEDIMPDGNSGDNALHALFAQLNIPDGEFQVSETPDRQEVPSTIRSGYIYLRVRARTSYLRAPRKYALIRALALLWYPKTSSPP
ncbi:hypothetical protein C7999DRAFT_36373 [Corynascus novoguineensis]|uniref:Uncharacterized protein n=1 Tax=Corynascus novoguineensis TaxID=1126955 RepID=A0AAN7HB41_9PEZI|nr:hypothetical protein C7999DRAFT_36373 [Corynascus novoguineensis]